MIADLFPVTAVTEPKVVRLHDREIPYLLKRSRQRRRIVLTVDEQGLAVSAPWRSSEQRVVAVILDAESWVLKKLQAWSALPVRHQTWADGDQIKFLGTDLALCVVEDASVSITALETGHILRIQLPDSQDGNAVKTAVIHWYRRHAQANFAKRIAELAPRLGVAPPRFFLSSARTRWGSCNADWQVRLNWRLIQASQSTIDYVVVHELAHLIEMNHSKRFWNLVASVCPAHKDARAELDRMGRYYLDL
ncbi:MAG: M48 family metallopeptidase [Burkholderiales bacterium]